jgi:UDP-sugar transporter A1/2/3
MSATKRPLSGADESHMPNMQMIFILLLLAIQNSGHALLTRYSQGILKEDYSKTEVVMVGEVIKMVVSGYLAVVDRSETDAQGSGVSKLMWLVLHSKQIIVLVILYSVANVMSYYALARVDASVYTVLLQLKIFTTAAFAVLMLGRNISFTKWRALLLLVFGCILVASPSFNQLADCVDDAKGGRHLLGVGGGGSGGGSGGKKKGGDASGRTNVFESIVGVFTVLTMVTISGYSAIYFEKMLKKTAEVITIWERNFQLALYSVVFLMGIIVYELQDEYAERIEEKEPLFFKGWTTNAVMLALVQAVGGLLVAATLKYADAVLKTLATSGAIVMSAVLGWFLFGARLDINVWIGCLSVILAIVNYTWDNTPA